MLGCSSTAWFLLTETKTAKMIFSKLQHKLENVTTAGSEAPQTAEGAVNDHIQNLHPSPPTQTLRESLINQRSSQ